jgi:type I restriction-modification system DNA methylase subunit
LNIKVLDPACGSGAFLNEAFDYLHSECLAANSELERLLKSQSDAVLNLRWDRHILANNIFGVDLNRESVDITKLSLWLKTASRDEKLIDLDNNIKVGNSLISDKNIAGDLAFDWSAEFPDIMASGGFDVVLGNPPYGAALSQSEKDYIIANYETTEYNFDTYKTFMELGLKLTKSGGCMGFITPNTYFVLEKGANKLRRFLFENYTLLNIAELFNVFPTAVVEPAISIYKNAPPKDNDRLEAISVPRRTDLTSTFISDGVRTTFLQSDLRKKEGYSFNYRETETEKQIIEKINKIAKPLSEYFTVTTGAKPYQKGKGTPPQTQETVNTKPFESYEKTDDTWIPYIRGKTIGRYTDAWDGKYIKYGEWLAESRNADMFKNEKLFMRQTGDYPIATYDASGKVGKNTIHCIYQNHKHSGIFLKYVLGLINSKFMGWLFQHENFHIVGKPLAEIKKIYIERFPIVVAKDQSLLIQHVDRLLINSQARFDKTKQFIDYIKAIYSPKSMTEKIREFYKLDLKEFIDELKKQNSVLTSRQQMELMPLFNDKRKEIKLLTQTIDKLEHEVDCMVYALYDLTPDEIAIVEGNL